MGNLIRSMTLNLDELARDVLVSSHQHGRAEVVMEVYRHIVVTGMERGTRWRKNDPWSHARYPNFSNIVGRTTNGAYEDLYFALDDSLTSDEHIARVISRAVLGSSRTLARWRRDQGSMTRATIPVRVRRAAGERWCHLRALLTDPVGRRIKPQFNSMHSEARILRRALLIPSSDGWALGIEYGCTDDPRPSARHHGAASSWVAQQSRAHEAADPQHQIPVQRDKEPTSLFVHRCADYINSITEIHR